MKTRFASLFLLGVLVAVDLSAQTKTSGTVTCNVDPAAPPPVALTDKPDHSFVIGKLQCTWANWTVAGVQAKDGTSTDVGEITGNTTSYRGYHVGTMANGDTFVVKYEGTGKLKDGKPLSGDGTWSYVSGTGKLKGIKGKGTYKGTANADGSATYQVDGDYSLP